MVGLEVYRAILSGIRRNSYDESAEVEAGVAGAEVVGVRRKGELGAGQ
jgi:hypothetical protein